MTPENNQINCGCLDGQKYIENNLLTDNKLSFYQPNFDNQFSMAKEIAECFYK